MPGLHKKARLRVLESFIEFRSNLISDRLHVVRGYICYRLRLGDTRWQWIVPAVAVDTWIGFLWQRRTLRTYLVWREPDAGGNIIR